MGSGDDKTIIADAGSLAALANPPNGKACLIQYSGTRVGKRYILDENDMDIGRIETTDIYINDPSISRKHCHITIRNNICEINDLGSSNGTFVNEKRIETIKLKHNDMVRIGSVILKYIADGNSEGAFMDNIYKKATIDATTAIYNKQYLIDELDSHFKLSKNYGRPLSLIIFDLDHFKKVNDVYGHNAGDFILKGCAQLAKQTIRKTDMIARFGGEEFVIILPDTEKKQAVEMAERVRSKIGNSPFKIDGKLIKQTISAGVSLLTDRFKNPKELIEDADHKLYQAKKTGRNKVNH